MRAPLFVCLLLATGITAVRAQVREVSTGLFRDQVPKEVLAAPRGGAAVVVVDDQEAGTISAKDALRISSTAHGITARSLSRTWSAKRTVELRPATGGYLHLSTTAKPARHRDVESAVMFRRMGGSMLVSTTLPLEAYVAGVVQAESGDKRPVEYYKLQAVICRTYALTNARKHLAEGFSVCDGTHCQVFKGRCTLPDIRNAVAATRDMVVVDAGIRLIHATFHSNCGGQTINAEDVWSRSEPYLVSAMDSFCVRSTHATWQRTMPRGEWLAYLQRSFGLDPADSASVHTVTHFAPPCRSLYFDGARPLIPLQRVRQDLRLNSTYFDVRSEGDQVILEGRGFGHGVGLCQEGAMRMAELGIPFTGILHHYFAEVHLVDLNSLAFFRDDGP